MTARTVVHITAALGAGVGSAVCDYVESTPELRHRVVGLIREPGIVGRLEGISRKLDLSVVATTSRAQWTCLCLDAMRREVRSDAMVHAHSSIAGGLVRAVSFVAPDRVVYSPHGLSFQRDDVSSGLRLAFASAERALALGCSRFGAVGQYERSTIEVSVAGRRRVVLVPHRLQAGLVRCQYSAPRTSAKIVGLGRIAPQKDPVLFARIARDCLASGVVEAFDWIGDGEPRLRGALEDAGVNVVGWLTDRESITERLGGASALLLTSRWEGLPLALLEALAAGTPVIMRRIPSIAAETSQGLFETPAEALALIRSLDSCGEALHARQCADLDRSLSQGQALANLYAMKD